MDTGTLPHLTVHHRVTPAGRPRTPRNPLFAVNLGEILKQRLFPSRIPVPERWARYYFRQVRTRTIPAGSTHQRSYAV